MKFTIHIPVKNEEKYIGRLLSSILFQNVDFEIIINVNPATNDNTLTIVKAYQSFIGEDKMKIYYRPEREHLHDSAQRCLEMATGDIWIATSAHSHFLEGALAYVEGHFEFTFFGSVLHEDLRVQHPWTAEDMSGYSMFIGIPFMRENGLGYDPRYPDIADYVLRKRIWLMGKAKMHSKITTMCSPRPSFVENNGHLRAPQYVAFKAELKEKGLI